MHGTKTGMLLIFICVIDGKWRKKVSKESMFLRRKMRIGSRCQRQTTFKVPPLFSQYSSIFIPQSGLIPQEIWRSRDRRFKFWNQNIRAQPSFYFYCCPLNFRNFCFHKAHVKYKSPIKYFLHEEMLSWRRIM